jgi:hypothetical protein
MMSALLDRVIAWSGHRAGSDFEFKPWREVGWIFKDGQVCVIERHGGEIRARSTLV